MNTTKLKLTINGKEREIEATSVAGALRELGIETDARSGIAVALNGEVVRRGNWNDTELAQDDDLEVIGATQGG